MRKIAVGLVIAVFGVALAGCNTAPATNNTGGNGTSNSSPAPKPGDVLAAAVSKTASTNFKFTLGDSSDHGNGVYSTANKGISFSQVDSGATMKLVIIGEDMYLS